jgi:hypothetical protein
LGAYGALPLNGVYRATLRAITSITSRARAGLKDFRAYREVTPCFTQTWRLADGKSRGISVLARARNPGGAIARLPEQARTRLECAEHR